MPSFDFKRLNRTITIYRIVQALLLCLLIFVVYYFQVHFTQLGTPEKFFASVKFTIIIQVLLVYPIYRLAWRDAGVDLDSCVIGLTKEQLAVLRKKHLMGDLWKFSAFGFFLIFVYLVPGTEKAGGASRPILAIALFSFLLMCLTYYQCFNYSAKKRMKQAS